MLLLLASCSRAETYNVTLASYNYTDRPISWYLVDDTGGGNVFGSSRSGGGKWACCARVTVGAPVHIHWRLSYTEKQYEEGVRPEEHNLTVVVPKPDGSESPRYMEVHFYAENRVQLRLVSWPGNARWPAGTDMSKLDDY